MQNSQSRVVKNRDHARDQKSAQPNALLRNIITSIIITGFLRNFLVRNRFGWLVAGER